MGQDLKSSATARKKRLGQYFTGSKLARVLVSLLNEDSKSLNIIDPMVGIGDMLVEVAKVDHLAKSMTGIEIDYEAHDKCNENLQSLDIKTTLIRSDAFNPKVWDKVGTNWDLVITNPPYVRYQSLSKSNDDIPSGDEIRQNLMEILSKIDFENEIVREDFLRVARAYSGLSDLAVPCWILCMAICKIQGQIALVLPSTWLSREYASPVLYLLRRYFALKVIVEDTDVCWFPGTQVRTTALIATRISDQGNATTPNSHKVVSIKKQAGNDLSLVGKAFPDTIFPERDFAKWVRNIESQCISNGIAVKLSDESDMIQKISKSGSKVSRTPIHSIPEKLQKILPLPTMPIISIEELGWQVGQGLRTGANEFFYLSESDIPDHYKSRLQDDRLFCLPKEALLPALTRQHQLPPGYLPLALENGTYLLYLRNWEYQNDSKLFDQKHIIDGDLISLIKVGEEHSYIRSGKTVNLPALSAVKTNIRLARSGEQENNWYQLPELTKRHLPDLFLPRIVGTEIKTYINADSKLVIDANFNTLWVSSLTSIPKFAMLTLMNSDWTKVWLESVCTQMGGGALKVEAINLKSLCFPKAVLDNLFELDSIGQELANSGINSEEVRSRLSQLMGLENVTNSLKDLYFAMSQLRIVK